jgi:hypothetical protein
MEYANGDPMPTVRPCLLPKYSLQTLERPKLVFPFLLSSVWRRVLICPVSLVSIVKITKRHLWPLGPSTSTTSSASSSIPPPLLAGFHDHVVRVLRRLCSLASNYVASAGPRAKASATTIGWFLPSFPPSTLQVSSFGLGQICNIRA